MLQRSGSSFSATRSAVLVACMYIAGSLLTTYLADLLGRKKLNILSLTGSAIGLFSFAIYQYLKLNGFKLSSFDWVPAMSLSFVILISTAGIMPLSILCSAENLPSKVRSLNFVLIEVVWKCKYFAHSMKSQTKMCFFTFYNIMTHNHNKCLFVSGENNWNDNNWIKSQHCRIYFVKTISNTNGKVRIVRMFNYLW